MAGWEVWGSEIQAEDLNWESLACIWYVKMDETPSLRDDEVRGETAH